MFVRHGERGTLDVRPRYTLVVPLIVGLIGWFVPAWPAEQVDDPLRDARLQMVKQFVETEGIKDHRVLDQMKRVPRHEFVPNSLLRQAYFDQALPIGYGQTISSPFIVAYMTDLLALKPTDRVLEIGTGSGYQAAVLSGLVKDVYTIEIVDALATAAKKRLGRLGHRNVFVRSGDGYVGWPEHAPFDKIIVTCSPEHVPRPLIDQLSEGGSIIIPLGEYYQQTFHLLEKRNGQLVERKLIPTHFVPMTGISEAERAIQPDAAVTKVFNGSFEIDQDHDERPDGWHYLRRATLVEKEPADGRRCLRFNSDIPGSPAQALQAIPLDGRNVDTVGIRLWVKCSEVVKGEGQDQEPAIVLRFYDSMRRPISEAVLGPWTGSTNWRRFAYEIRQVPTEAREAFIRIGLNGATGQFCVDGIELVTE